MEWRFLDTGPGSAAFNMGVDEALLEGIRDGTSPPTLRTYTFSPPSFSIGYLQDLAREIDRETCAAHGIQWVRRPTGGRTVLHGWDLTYSVTASIDDIAAGGTISDAYRGVSTALIQGLFFLGVAAEFERPRRSEPRERVARPCFTSISRFEVSSRSRKIVGSAQRVIGRDFLQHGSLPLSEPPLGPHAFVPRLGREERAHLGEELRARSTSLSQELGREVSYAETGSALRKGFEKILVKTIASGALSGREGKRAEALCREKYAAREWNERGPTRISRT
jgi:lipoate-protein ligase A